MELYAGNYLHVKRLIGPFLISNAARELRRREFASAKKRVERLMRENGIRARHKRRYKVTTDSKHGLPVAAKTGSGLAFCP